MTLQEMQKAVYQNKINKGFNVTNIEKKMAINKERTYGVVNGVFQRTSER